MAEFAPIRGPVHGEYTFTAQEWREATWAAARGRGDPQRSRKRRVFWFWTTLLVVLLVMLSQVQFLAGPQPAATTTAPAEPPQGFFVAYVLPLVPWVVVMGAVWFVVIRRFGFIGAWSRHPMSQVLNILDAGDEGLQVATDVTLTRVRWEAFIGWAESPRLLFLRLKTGGVVPIPKRAFDPAALDVLRRMVRDRVAPRGAFPVLPPTPGGLKPPPLPGGGAGQGGP